LVGGMGHVIQVVGSNMEGNGNENGEEIKLRKKGF